MQSGDPAREELERHCPGSLRRGAVPHCQGHNAKLDPVKLRTGREIGGKIDCKAAPDPKETTTNKALTSSSLQLMWEKPKRITSPPPMPRGGSRKSLFESEKIRFDRTGGEENLDKINPKSP